MSYRVAGYMDTVIGGLDHSAADYVKQMMDAIEEFAIEDSIMKIYGSEAADFAADESVQIHGGYGYSHEYEVERVYRDSRINRIFEGTNEINRMLIPGIILKRTMKGELPLFDVIGRAEAALGEDRAPQPEADDAGLESEIFLCNKGKLLAVYMANVAIQKHMADFKDQQELMLAIADMITAVYAIDSTVCRVSQMVEAGQATDVHLALAQVIAGDHYQQIVDIAMRLAPCLANGDALDALHAKIDKLIYRPRTDFIGLKRLIAAHVIEHPPWNL